MRRLIKLISEIKISFRVKNLQLESKNETS